MNQDLLPQPTIHRGLLLYISSRSFVNAMAVDSLLKVFFRDNLVLLADSRSNYYRDQKICTQLKKRLFRMQIKTRILIKRTKTYYVHYLL